MATLVSSHFSIPYQVQTAAFQVNAGLSLDNLRALALFDLEARLNNELKDNKNNLSNLNTVVKELKTILTKKFPTFDDFMSQLCESQPRKLTEIRIDAIMQRKLLMNWIIEILNNVRPTRIMALNVYETSDANGKTLYSCWDGQHTAIVLYIIATQVYGITDLDKILVPTVIYKGDVADIRKNFTALNTSEGKQLLDEYDIYQQRVISSRLDGSKDILDTSAEEVQKICEEHDVFITHPKFGDDHNAGAISRLREVKKYVWKKGRLDVFENTIKLHNKLFKTCPFENNELNVLFDFFDICQSNMVPVDDNYIDEMAKALRGQFNNWDRDFKNQVRDAYVDWWNQSFTLAGHARFDARDDQLSDYLIRLLEESDLFDDSTYDLPNVRNTNYLTSSF